MKTGLVQINATIGAFPANCERIKRGYDECVASGAELVLTPEFAICGYPPKDLIFRSHFVPGNLAALENLAKEVGEVPLLVGYADVHHGPAGRPFLNAAALLQNGEIRQRFAKCLLPTYDVFDESRYFQPASEVGWFDLNERRIGVTICEDIWTEEYLPARLYVENPPKALADAGCELIVNLSASPYHAGKPAEREAMLRGVVQGTGCAIVYCNAVAGNDHLIFDGNSLVINAKGAVHTRLAGFREEVAVVDPFHEEASPLPFEGLEEPAEMFAALVLGVRDYFAKCGFKSAVIGLSGGIDSALTAAVAAEAIGAENVHGVTMPSHYSSAGSVSDSQLLAQHLGIECLEVPIREIFDALRAQMKPVFGDRPEDVTEENMQARIRGLILMSMANKFGHLLLTTGNKSELAVGYCTIYGDMCGGLAVISDLPKTKVYEIARWLNREREVIPWNTIDKPPSAELRPDQKDQDTLPPYEVLDAILELYVEDSLDPPDIVARGYDEETVRWIARRVELNEWKRQQAAPGIRVTTKAFGFGRRFPIAQRFRS